MRVRGLLPVGESERVVVLTCCAHFSWTESTTSGGATSPGSLPLAAVEALGFLITGTAEKSSVFYLQVILSLFLSLCVSVCLAVCVRVCVVTL